MKKILILTEDLEHESSPAIKEIRRVLRKRKCETQIYNIWADKMGDINPAKFDFAVTCLPNGHTKLPVRMEVFMAAIAGMPDAEVSCLAATYSADGDLRFHKFKSEVEYRPGDGQEGLPFALLADENSDNLLQYKRSEKAT